jgi:hypothetical protein
MATKMTKGQVPAGSTIDYECFGPPATEDGEFSGVMIADLGSFTQDGKNSNKYYHAAVCKHKPTGDWYVYLEWGRVGAANPQFQFVKCSSQAEAQEVLAKQCHSKNDKRGVWITVAGHKTLSAKPKKDVYLVRPLATRSTGLPDAKSIKHNEGDNGKAAATKPKVKKKRATKKVAEADRQTAKLLTDLVGATISYTKGAMADASIPTQGAIDVSRDMLGAAKLRVAALGGSVDDQVADPELKELSTQLYRRIGKKMATRGVSAHDWILNNDNIFSWEQDLDAFESALHAEDWESTSEVVDPYHGMPLTMSWIDPKSNLGEFLYFWWPQASRKQHYRSMKIANMWEVSRHGDENKITKAQDEVLKGLGKKQPKERPLFQPSKRLDVAKAEQDRFHQSNTAMLFHGTRSVNVSGILRESLKLPRQLVGVAINGAMYGPGLYFADDWGKSAGYTSIHGSAWSRGAGGVSRRKAFMFACDVVLGEPSIAGGSRGYTSAPRGYHSVFAQGAGSGGRYLRHNEFIVYQAHQQRLRYLAEFEV